MDPDRRIIVAALSVALTALVGAAALASSLNDERAAIGLVLDEKTAAELPPDVRAAQMALGSFRGLATTVMWLRAQQLEEQGRYHASVQLSRAIARLQPRMIGVWSFLAHNLSFNIVAAMPDPAERWLWVRKGAGLLREGIALNPHDPTLYLDMVRLYLLKIDGPTAEYAPHFQVALAKRWDRLLGRPPRAVDPELDDWLAPLATAHRSIEAMTAADSATREAVLRLRALRLKLDLTLLDRLRALDDKAAGRGLGIDAASSASERALTAWWRATPAASRRQIIAYIRAREVRRTEGLEPEMMHALSRQFGPIDWRHPGAHQLYWAALGRLRFHPAGWMTEEEKAQYLIAFDRQIHDALAKLSREGRLRITGDRRVLSAEPGVLPAYRASLEAALVATPDETADTRRRRRSLRGRYYNTLAWAVRSAYYAGDETLARTLYRELREAEAPGTTAALEAFIWRVNTLNVQKRSLTVDDTRDILVGMLLTAVETGLADGDTDRAKRILARAQRLDEFARRASQGMLDENRLPPLAILWADAFHRYLVAPDAVLIPCARAWRLAPVALRRQVYDHALEALKLLCQRNGADVTKAFPEPPGMDAFRKEREGAGSGR